MRFWKPYVGGFIILFISVFSSLIVPLLLRVAIDSITGESNASLWLLGIGIIFVSFLSGLANFFTRYLNEVAAQSTIKELRNKMFEKLQYQSMSFFQGEETGQLMARVTTDLNAMRRYLSVGFRILLQAILTYVGIITIMFLTSVKFAVIVIVLSIVLYLIAWRFSKEAAPVFLEQRVKYGDLTSKVQETLTGIQVVKGFGLEDEEYQRFSRANTEYLQLKLEGAKIRAKYIPLITFLLGLGTVTVLILGGIDVIAGKMSLGTLVAFISYLGMLTMPTRFIAWYLVMHQRANASAIRCYEILDVGSEVKEPPNPIELNIKGKVEFKNVWFSYENGTMVLQGINLLVPEKQTIAILGGTGSGKSSLISLIPRFYDPIKGEILVDDVNIKQVKLEHYRKQIGIVMQETFLFNATIRENISFGKPNATIEEIIDAASKAQAHEFIMELPKGYETKIGEKGITLSGGQKQRLALARALLLNPKILILDDSTSSVDTQTETLIQQELVNIMKERTTFIITNRVSGLRLVDRIIVLEHGKIVEEGTHEELLAKGGLYHKIYTSQVEKKNLGLQPKVMEG